MILQVTEIAGESLGLIDEHGVVGVLTLIIVGLCLVIRILWKDKKESRDAWILTLEAKEKQIEQKDSEIKEMKQDDRDLVKEVTAAIRDGVNVDQQLIRQNEKIIESIEILKSR